ncbi:MAG TPA: hypothetical protein VLI05_06690 [Candidatus Saccharimonadia bacterium]|nr:hypothetical protein [Candidatus Saccharimonadia bacterium]
MSRFTRSLLIGMVAAAVPSLVLAADILPSPTPTPGPVSSAQQSAHLNRLKTNGAAEADRRRAALQDALSKVQGSTKLDAATKKALTDQLQAEITKLTTTESKLGSETDLTSARIDAQTIFAEYGAYALLLSKAQLLAAADRLVLAGGKLQVITGHLEAKINGAQTQGKDVTAAQKRLTDLKAKLAHAKLQYDGLAAKAMPLTVADYANSHKALATEAVGLATARSDFQVALDDVNGIVSELSNLKTATPTPSPSPSASPSPAAH